MADMQFDLVSPERSLASYAVASVLIPGTDGDMTVMADHAPTITTLRPGMMEVTTASETVAYVVLGGFAEIGAGSVSVLAEEAMEKSEATPEFLQEKIEAARRTAESALSDTVDLAHKRVSDLEALKGALG